MGRARLQAGVASEQVLSLSVVPQVQGVHIQPQGGEYRLLDSEPPAHWRLQLRSGTGEESGVSRRQCRSVSVWASGKSRSLPHRLV